MLRITFVYMTAWAFEARHSPRGQIKLIKLNYIPTPYPKLAFKHAVACCWVSSVNGQRVFHCLPLNLKVKVFVGGHETQFHHDLTCVLRFSIYSIVCG